VCFLLSPVDVKQEKTIFFFFFSFSIES